MANFSPIAIIQFSPFACSRHWESRTCSPTTFDTLLLIVAPEWNVETRYKRVKLILCTPWIRAISWDWPSRFPKQVWLVFRFGYSPFINICDATDLCSCDVAIISDPENNYRDTTLMIYDSERRPLELRIKYTYVHCDLTACICILIWTRQREPEAGKLDTQPLQSIHLAQQDRNRIIFPTFVHYSLFKSCNGSRCVSWETIT